jgi:hypothetical protein
MIYKFEAVRTVKEWYEVEAGDSDSAQEMIDSGEESPVADKTLELEIKLVDSYCPYCDEDECDECKNQRLGLEQTLE